MSHFMRHIVEMDEQRAKDSTRALLRLLGLLKPYWLAVLGSLLLILISAATQAAGPILIGRAIDSFISRGEKSGLANTMLALVGVYAVNWFAMRYQMYLMSWAGTHVLADLRVKIMDRVQNLSLQFLESKETGDLMSRLVNDVDAINNFVSQSLAQTVGSLFSLIGVVVAMFFMHWQLALATLSVVPLMLLATGRFARMARQAFRKTRTTIGDVSADLQEELGGVKVAQAFNRGNLNVRRFAERNAANRDANVSANAVTSAFMPAMDVLSTLDMAIVAGYGGYLAVQHTVSVGLVVAFLQYVQSFFRPVQMLTSFWTMAQAAFAGAERVFELLDSTSEIQDAPGAEAIPPIRGQVWLDDVSFGYLSKGEEAVLCNINLEAQAGQTVALVGPTGAGKTTLAGLIIRFFDATSGQVLIDGHDVRQVTQKSLRSQMAMVLQEPFLFSGSVIENIRYGKLDASDEAVVEAAKVANAHDFINRLPEGYNTQVGERGSMLSQGQRQLISIARAILADPRILILDEATASVDTRTEVLIQRALGRLLKGRTSFVIAHRLSTVRNADQVIVIDEGEIVERGTHASLIDAGGLYSELYRRQFYTPEEAKPVFSVQ